MKLTGSKIATEVKTFIVQGLARFDSPSDVSRSVNNEFGLTVSRQRVEAYDPTKRAGAGLKRRWRDLFAETRSDFIAKLPYSGIGKKLVRLRALDRPQRRAEAAGNLALAAKILEQAAKEVGGAFDRRGDRRPAGFR